MRERDIEREKLKDMSVFDTGRVFVRKSRSGSAVFVLDKGWLMILA